MKIGFLRLTDAAPVVIAQELGFFAGEGVDASLSVEPSWSSLADKLALGHLDAAVIMPPLAFALNLGIRGDVCRLLVPQVVNLGGDTITLGRRLMADLPPPGKLNGASPALAFAERFKDRIHSGPASRLRLAVVHQYSTHHLLLRYWLAAGGIDPDHDVTYAFLPPAQMADALSMELIDGFCAGAPWGDIAEDRGAGTTVVSTHGIWRNGPEKVFAVQAGLAERDPQLLVRVQRALLQAAQYCDRPENTPEVAAILARPDYLNVDAATLSAALPGPVEEKDLWRRPALRFFAHAAPMPWVSHGTWVLQQMQRWGQIDAGVDCSAAARALYRPDMYRKAAVSLGFAVPQNDEKQEGHSSAWSLEGHPCPIAMEADGFCDIPL
jgi:ABC-type nitrate/sulfonate/bicarbonate transport systems, periplasmic components